VGVSLNNAWAPRFMAAPKGADAAGNRAVSPVFVSAVGVASVALAGTAPVLMTLISSGDYGGAEVYAPVLGAAFVCATLYLVLVNPLLKSGRTPAVSAATLTWAVLNLTANVILIPLIGAWGPALVTLATYAGLSVTVAALLGRADVPRFLDVPEVLRSVAGSLLGLALLALTPLPLRLLMTVPALVLAGSVMGLYRISRVRASWSAIWSGGRAA
jgi:O-antigen/teichoic acid export membrane protein